MKPLLTALSEFAEEKAELSRREAAQWQKLARAIMAHAKMESPEQVSAEVREALPVPLPENKRFYTLKEVARYAGISKSTLYVLLGNGKLKAKKCGGRTLITAEALKAWTDSFSRYGSTR